MLYLHPSLKGRGRGWVGAWRARRWSGERPTPNPSLPGRGAKKCYRFRPLVIGSGFFGFTQPGGGVIRCWLVPSPIAPGCLDGDRVVLGGACVTTIEGTFLLP